MAVWIEKTPEFVGARYDRLAPIYQIFEYLHALPYYGIRRRAVEAMALRPGDAVLEVGCGTGNNFARIEAKIGPGGAIYGVDLAAKMLERAERKARRNGWANVHLTQGDAFRYAPPRPVQAALFCFSYSTMRDRSALARRAWDLLAPGGRLVVADVALDEGGARERFMGMSVWVSSRTLVGKPDTDPAADLASFAGAVETERIRATFFLSHFLVCRATKPAA
jgi:ubiquinone/menaquinone biosynthesis C-methylase UbiE